MKQSTERERENEKSPVTISFSTVRGLCSVLHFFHFLRLFIKCFFANFPSFFTLNSLLNVLLSLR